MTLRVPAEVTIWPEHSDRGGRRLPGSRVERLAQVVLEQSLRALAGQQRLGVVALPQPQADRLHLGQADVAAEPNRLASAVTSWSARAGESSRAKCPG